MTWSPGFVVHYRTSETRRRGEHRRTTKVVRDIVPGRMPPRVVGLSVFVAEEAADAVAMIWPMRQWEIDAKVEQRAFELWHMRRAWPLVRSLRRFTRSR